METKGNEKKVGSGELMKKSNRDEKQRDAKMEDQIEKVLKQLGNGSAEQKILNLARNLVELENLNNRQSVTLKQSEKSFDTLQREKDRLQAEYNKGVLIKHKLEQVCREQQKIMKSIKSESLSKIRDEEEKRKETQQHFQQSINEIFTTLGKNNDENAKLKEANLEITKKFKYLAEQYEMREKQMAKTNEQINLSTQLNDAKLAKLKMESTIEREILLKEKEATLEDLLSAKKLIIEMQEREKILKEQLYLYTDKYADFQSSLQKSNDVFESYKTEMSKMAKKIKSLEKETFEWRSKYEKSTKAMLEMASDKTAQDQYVGKASRQLTQLQKLCRTLQAERTSLLDVLKANNLERPPMPELPPEPIIEPPPKSADKLDIMSRNCSELKKTLAVLQSQMNALTAEKSTIESTVTANLPAKKSKNKKNKANKTCPIKDRSVGKVPNSKETVTTNVNSVGNDEVESDNVVIIDDNEMSSIKPFEIDDSHEYTEKPVANDKITDSVDDLVEGVTTSCAIESQPENDLPTQEAIAVEKLTNGEADGIAVTSSEAVESISQPTQLNNADSVPCPVEISAAD